MWITEDFLRMGREKKAGLVDNIEEVSGNCGGGSVDGKRKRMGKFIADGRRKGGREKYIE